MVAVRVRHRRRQRLVEVRAVVQTRQSVADHPLTRLLVFLTIRECLKYVGDVARADRRNARLYVTEIDPADDRVEQAEGGLPAESHQDSATDVWLAALRDQHKDEV